jgi:hypothetical protein
VTDGEKRRLLDGALTWIDRHLAYFDPFKHGQLTGLREIPLAELAILILSATRSIEPVEERFVSRWLDLLQSTYENPTYQQRPFREPETLVSHAVVAAALESAGREPSFHRESVERLVRVSTLTAPALPPHRLMELRHALDLARIRHALPSYRTLFLNSLPAHRVNPICLSTPETYIFTHVIFYAADLGHRRPMGFSARDRARIAKLVEQLLGMNIVSGNWDLTAELILSVGCLGSSSPFVEEGWECIGAAQRPDGAVPGPRAQARPTDEATSALPQPDSDVATCYHTTLVSCLAALAPIAA